MEKLKIAVRCEGGIGDCILGIRFIPAILEKHPGSEIHGFIDSEGNPSQENVLRKCFGYLFTSITTIPSKKYKEFWINTQFGCDNYFGAIENVPDEWLQKMQQFDLLYDLHADSLKWMNADYPWLKFFYTFPTPAIIEPDKFTKEQIFRDCDGSVVMNLVSESSGVHRVEKWWITNFVNKIARKAKVFLISTPKINEWYNEINNPNVVLVNTEIENLVYLISKASLMVSTDSGLKYLAYGLGIPTIEFSGHSNGPHSCISSHRIRWNIYPERCFPLNFDTGYMSECIFRILEDKGYALLPNIVNLDNQLVRRKWTLNVEKSILNK